MKMGHGKWFGVLSLTLLGLAVDVSPLQADSPQMASGSFQYSWPTAGHWDWTPAERYFNVNFLYDTRRFDPSAPILQRDTAELKATIENLDYSAAQGLLNLATDLSQYPNLSLSQYRGILETQGRSLSVGTRLYLLSLWGEQLLKGYDLSEVGSTTPMISEEQVFQNARVQGKAGGICNEIHRELALFAESLGFESAGNQTLYLPDGVRKGALNAHVISFFRDPVSGEFFTQNYGVLFSTGKTSLTQAVDVQTQVISTFAGSVEVQSGPNQELRLYQPASARWVSNLILNASNFVPGRSWVNVQVGDHSQMALLDLSAHGEHGGAKMFFVGSKEMTAEGVYDVQIFGLAAEYDARKNFGANEQSFASLFVSGAGGVFGASIPTLSTDGLRDQIQHSFARGTMRGTLNLNGALGQAEVFLQSLDLDGQTKLNPVQSMNNYARFTAGYEPADSWFALLMSRTYELDMKDVKRSMLISDLGSTSESRIAYDKVDVIVHKETGKIYLRWENSYYILDGLKERTATGIRSYMWARFSTDKLGSIIFVSAISRVLQSQDSFYSPAGATSVQGMVQWEKDIKKWLTVGVGARYDSAGRPLYVFEVPEFVTPEISGLKKNLVTGFVFAKTRF